MLILPVNADAATNQRLRDKIIDNNPLKTSQDFNVTANDTNTDAQEGLFSINDQNGTSHFFRGTHQLNNNVIFAGHQWKILRIESNGNIRLIYNGLCPDNNCVINGAIPVQMAAIGAGIYNLNTDNTSFAFEGSVIQGTINSWFSDNANFSAEDRELIAQSTFCNELVPGSLELHNIWGLPSAGDGLGNNTTIYEPIQRLVGLSTPFGLDFSTIPDITPQLTCPNEFIINSYAGLITADELSIAGGVILSDNHNFFLNSGSEFWTMTPGAFMDNFAEVFTGGAFPSISANFIHNDMSEIAIRPVISLNSEVTVVGDGSAANPYIITGLYEETNDNSGNNNDNNNHDVGQGSTPNTPDNSLDNNSDVQTSDGTILSGYIALITLSGLIIFNLRKQKSKSF